MITTVLLSDFASIHRKTSSTLVQDFAKRRILATPSFPERARFAQISCGALIAHY